jgi:acetolactate synthase-1/2/3 large subunit
VVFGYPGATALALFDALGERDDIRIVLTRHEQGAAFAANGVARATGRAGTVLVTSGPGATNTVTAIADAYMDSIPLVVFTAQVATAVIGSDAFQETDIFGVTMPITKHSFLVKDARDLPFIIDEAYRLATTGRPGPVLVDIPVDVAEADIGDDTAGEYVPSRAVVPDAPAAAVLARAAQMLTDAERPLILAGGGVIASGASDVLTQLAHANGIPVVSTLMGRGAFNEDDPAWLGMAGMFGHASANAALHAADVLLAVGTRFAERVAADPTRLAPGGQLIHVDIDAAEVDKRRRADLALIGDARAILGAIQQHIQQLAAPGRSDARAAGLSDVDRGTAHETPAQTPAPTTSQGADTRPAAETVSAHMLTPEYIIAALDRTCRETELLGRPTIRVTEVGQNQMWTAVGSRFRTPRSLLTSGGLAAMGFGLPAATGAAIARPDALVVNISGDGSFQMNLQELATVAGLMIPLKVFILNNAGLGLVRQWQDARFGGRHVASDLAPDLPDIVALAHAYGLVGMRAATCGQFDTALIAALATPGPAIVDCRISPDAHVSSVEQSRRQMGDVTEGSR